MKIRDYELINDIGVLFERKIVVYGIGFWGRRLLGLLKQAEIPVELLCDREAISLKDSNIPVVLPNELEDIILSNEYMVIVGSENYKEEIIDSLSSMEIDAYVCTWYGVQSAIVLNIDNEVFSDKFRAEVKYRKGLYFKNTETIYWLNHFVYLSKQYHPILIYQPGKVGSSTVRYTLDSLKIGNIHLHNFMKNRGSEKGLSSEIVTITDAQREYFREYFLANGVKIITLVRDPIAREISQFMQEFNEDYILLDINKPLVEYANEYIENNLLSNIEFEWFNNEIKQFCGIDIYAYPFDREKGYTIIKENNIEILVLKMEMLNENAEVIGDFIGKEHLQLVKANVGSKKHYKYIYEGLKKDIRISKETVDKIYERNPYFTHFYTQEEKEHFILKWKDSII